MKYYLHRWWLIDIANSGTLAPKKGHGFHTQWYTGETLTNPLPMRLTRSVCLLYFNKQKIKNWNMNMIKETSLKHPTHSPFLFWPWVCAQPLYTAAQIRHLFTWNTSKTRHISDIFTKNSMKHPSHAMNNFPQMMSILRDPPNNNLTSYDYCVFKKYMGGAHPNFSFSWCGCLFPLNEPMLALAEKGT